MAFDFIATKLVCSVQSLSGTTILVYIVNAALLYACEVPSVF